MIIEEIIREKGLKLRKIYSDLKKYIICEQTNQKYDLVITNNFATTYIESDEDIPPYEDAE